MEESLLREYYKSTVIFNVKNEKHISQIKQKDLLQI